MASMPCNPDHLHHLPLSLLIELLHDSDCHRLFPAPQYAGLGSPVLKMQEVLWLQQQAAATVKLAAMWTCG